MKNNCTMRRRINTCRETVSLPKENKVLLLIYYQREMSATWYIFNTTSDAAGANVEYFMGFIEL